MSRRRPIKNLDKINKIRAEKRKERKINNKKNALYKEDNKNRIKKTRTRKKRKNVLLRIMFLLLVVLLLVFGLYKIISRLFLEKSSNYGQIKSYFSSIDYDEQFKIYNKNLNYDNYEKKDGIYVSATSKNPDVINNIKNNYEDLLFGGLEKYLLEKSINQKDFSLYIEKNGKVLLSINEDKKHKGYNIKDFTNLLLVKHGIENKIFKINDEITIYRTDLAPSNIYSSKNIGDKVKLDRILNDAYTKDDKISKNIINRVLAANKITNSNTFNKILKESDFIDYSVKDIANLISLQDASGSTINSVFDSLLKEDNTLFLNSIYSPLGNKNLVGNEKEYKYDAGIVNTANKYIYSIYSEKLSDKDINIIGDIINRKIEEIESLKKIQG